MNNIDKEYQILLEYILGNGHEKERQNRYWNIIYIWMANSAIKCLKAFLS